MRILFISMTAPHPTSNGSSQRTNLLFRALSKCGDVALIVMDNPKNYTEECVAIMRKEYNLLTILPRQSDAPTGVIAGLDKIGGKIVARLKHNIDASSSRFKKLESLAKIANKYLQPPYEFDVIVGRYARSLAVPGLLESSLPKILDIDDLDSDSFLSQINSPNVSLLRKILLTLHYRNVEKNQKRVFSNIDLLWLANPENKAISYLKNASVLPNIPYLGEGKDFNTAPVATPKVLITIASFHYDVNVKGVDWFLKFVWPLVINVHPDSQFKIYGASIPDGLGRSWAEFSNVSVPGYIEDVADAYMECTMAVCPVLSGAGTNIKVLEAGAHRRLCILTEAASRGFGGEPKMAESLCVGETPSDMAEKINGYFSDLSRLRSDTDAFREAVNTSFSENRFFSIVKDDVSRIFPE